MLNHLYDGPHFRVPQFVGRFSPRLPRVIRDRRCLSVVGIPVPWCFAPLRPIRRLWAICLGSWDWQRYLWNLQLGLLGSNSGGRWWQPGTPGQENQLRLVGIIPLFTGFHTCQVVRISSINSIFHVPFKFGSLEIWGEDARMMSLFFWMLTFCWILEMRIYVAFQQSNALEDPPEPMLFECWTFSRLK